MELFSNITKKTIYFLTLLLLISHPKISCSQLPKPYTNFIKKSCYNTTYPSLCSATLSPYAATVKTNPFKLCNAALAEAARSARGCSAVVSGLSGQKYFSRPVARAVKDCVGDLKDVVYQLKMTAGAMARLSGPDREFQWASAKTYASAAITDADTCVDGLLSGRVVRNRIKRCVSDVERRVSIALALINHLY